MKICKICGTPNSDNAKFCKECGETLSELNLRCPRCNSVCSPSSKFCPKCGYRFTTSANYETQAIDVLDNNKMDEETYIEEQKIIKNKIFNKKINELNDEEYKSLKQEKVEEFHEDFSSSNSKIDAEKMLKIENRFHLISGIIALCLLIFASIIAFFPTAYLNGSDGNIYYYTPYYFLINKWSVIIDSFKWGEVINGFASSLGPILTFILLLGFIIFSITATILVFIKGLNCFNKKTYKNNFYIYVIIDAIIALLMYVAITLDEDLYMYYFTYYIFLILVFIYLVFIGVYYSYKAYLVGALSIVVRRIGSLVSSICLVLALDIMSFRIIITNSYNYNISDYLNALLVNFSSSNNALSYYLGFIGYFIYFFVALFLALSFFFSFKMIRQYNKARLYNLIFNSFGFALSIFSDILFTLSTYYSSLGSDYRINIYPIIVVILSGVSFVISLISFILLKDENIVTYSKIKENKGE